MMSSRRCVVSHLFGGLGNLPYREQTLPKELTMTRWFLVIAVIAIALLTFAAPAQQALPVTPETNASPTHTITNITWHECDGMAVMFDGKNATTLGPWWAYAPSISWALAIAGGGEEGGLGLSGAQIISTQWLGRDGLTHSVNTPVPPSTNGPELAVQRHDKMVKLMLQYYPKQ